MPITYQSTRGGVSGLSFGEAVLMGLPSDRGLLVPSSVPRFDAAKLASMEVSSATIRGTEGVEVAPWWQSVVRSAGTKPCDLGVDTTSIAALRAPFSPPLTHTSPLSTHPDPHPH